MTWFLTTVDVSYVPTVSFVVFILSFIDELIFTCRSMVIMLGWQLMLISKHL